MSEHFNISQYLLKAFYYGYPNILSGNQWKVYTNLLLITADNIENMNLEEIKKTNKFYVDFGYRKYHKDLGVSKTISKDIQVLTKLGLILEVNEGENDLGVSRVYFPLHVPFPEQAEVPEYVINKYKNHEEYFDRKKKKDKKRKTERKEVDWKNENYSDYYISNKHSIQEKRIRLERQGYILWSKNGAVLDKETKATIVKVIRKLIRDNSAAVVQNAIKSLEDEKIAPTKIIGALNIQINKNINHNHYKPSTSPKQTENANVSKSYKPFKEMVKERLQESDKSELETLQEIYNEIKIDFSYTEEEVQFVRRKLNRLKLAGKSK